MKGNSSLLFLTFVQGASFKPKWSVDWITVMFAYIIIMVRIHSNFKFEMLLL